MFSKLLMYFKGIRKKKEVYVHVGQFTMRGVVQDTSKHNVMIEAEDIPISLTKIAKLVTSFGDKYLVVIDKSHVKVAK